MAKELSNKELKFIELIVAGKNKTDAVMESYKPKNRNVGSVMANRLMKKEKVMNELNKRQEMLRQKTTNKEMRFIEILKSYAPPIEVAKRLAELIFERDKRTSDSAIEKYLRLSAEYPDTRQTLTIQLEKEREKILSEADIKKLVEQERLEEERKRLLGVEEGEIKTEVKKEIKENSGQ